MSVTDPIRVEYDEKREKFFLSQGRETFYVRCEDAEDPFHWQVNCWACDHLDELVTFGSEKDAVEWCEENLGVTPKGVCLE